MSNKRIQITSDFTSDVQHLHERVDHPNTGKTEIITETDPPKTTTHSVKVVTNPYKVEVDGEPKDTTPAKEASASKAEAINLEKKGYDTSEL